MPRLPRSLALAGLLALTSPLLQAEDRLRAPVGLEAGVAAIMDAIDWNTAEVIELTLGDHSYDPPDLVLERNQPYILRLRNEGRVSHDMVGGSFFSGVAIKMAQNAAGRVITPVLKSVYIKRGQQMEMWLVPIRAGTYSFFCSIDDHRALGMEGEITIR
ncbi:MAG: cupredoxin domain-containing protein [Rhodocyclaceae bacterium]|nr:cupredoxin domain-containing protein [Rhodocyclaceae bacterium]